MTARWTSRIAACALVFSMLVARSGADEPEAPPSSEDFLKAFAEAAKPGPEHARLNPLAGSWTYTCKCWMEPGKPPIETRGTIERKWILGGRFLQEHVAGTGFDGKPGFEGYGLLGYDKAQMKYTSTWICNLGTGTSTGLGEAEGSGKFTFQSQCTCPLLKTTIQGRDIIRIESEDRVVLEFYKIIEGKEAKTMELVAIRKK